MSIRVKRAPCSFCGAKPQHPCIKKENNKEVTLTYYHHDRQVEAARIIDLSNRKT